MIVQCRVSRGFRESEKNMGAGGEESKLQCQLDQRGEQGGRCLAMEAPEIHSN